MSIPEEYKKATRGLAWMFILAMFVILLWVKLR
jgi:hypothetical protein